MNRRERVIKAIEFAGPDRVPIWLFNRDQQCGDILRFGLTILEDNLSEWGFQWKRLDDGTMGQPYGAVIPTWGALKDYQFPTRREAKRLSELAEYKSIVKDHYQVASLSISGFTIYTFLRGFENAMIDFITDREKACGLLDGIMAFENDLITLAAEQGFDAIHFEDDWGTQAGLIISPELWRGIFKPRYKAQFEHAHKLGLHTWFHCCGNIEAVVGDFHEIGVDVMNISQPNVVDIEKVGKKLKGKQCFMVPISYQTVSITGTPQEIKEEGRRLYNALGAATGGFVGYVEEYSCMGMTEENYQACIDAFKEINTGK